MSHLSKPYFHSEKAAHKYLEKLLWPDGPVCPHCSSINASYDIKGKTSRVGLKKCGGCRKQFTVKVGTIFESSHVPLHKWLQAVYLLSASKKGVSAHQLHRTLEVTYKTAWFMAHRIREAMDGDSDAPPMDGNVQADETYFGKKDVVTKRTKRGRPTHSNQMSVVSLITKDEARTFHVDRATVESVGEILRQNVSKDAHLHTDESPLYTRNGKDFAVHETVKHTAGEYVRGEVSTNKCENYFSIFKRGMKGIYHHCSEKHLQRYLNEFDFRYNNRTVSDSERYETALQNVIGKRLFYKFI